MFSANTILNCYMAPKDAYSFKLFREWHAKTKRRWKQADTYGADEAKVLENNRRNMVQYKRRLKIMGWETAFKEGRGTVYEKGETFYQDFIGDPNYDYWVKFRHHILDWWGVGGRFSAKSKKDRNVKSIPNTPMLDVSFHMDSNSLMEKMYMNGDSYEEANETTFRGKALSAGLIYELSNFNKSQGMNDDDAYKESLRMIEIVHRNIALDKNSPTSNEYNFMINYYNKFIDSKIREMMKIQINIWFLKEAMAYNPNMSFFVLGPYNMLHRIQGLVGKRDQNVILQMSKFTNTKKYEFEYVYSVSKNTLVNEAEKGWIPAKKLFTETSKIVNVMHGRKKLTVDHRYRTEYFYDLILEGAIVNKRIPWFDALHNCWLSPDYSNPKNLRGLEIIC